MFILVVIDCLPSCYGTRLLSSYQFVRHIVVAVCRWQTEYFERS
jgi:hypothetical protein